jgi:hypothetical protein
MVLFPDRLLDILPSNRKLNHWFLTILKFRKVAQTVVM